MIDAPPTETFPITEAGESALADRWNYCPPINADECRDVLAHLAAGRRITAIGSTPGLPAYWIINTWRSWSPEFDEACVVASRAAAESMLWETIDIADDEERPAACRDVSIRARQFAMKVLDRKRFDPATRVELVEGVRDADELSDAELAVIARRGQRAGAQVIEGEVVKARAGAGGAPPLRGAAGGGGSASESPPIDFPLKRVDNGSAQGSGDS